MMSVAVNGACTGSNPQTCDPLPNGNGERNAAARVGSLGGVVDDFFQNYVSFETTSLDYKPINSMTTTQVIAKYGSIETWNTSDVTTMALIFFFKKNINPDIRNWIVDSVTTMEAMFYGTDAFNIDLSFWDVSSVVNMVNLFVASAYTRTLCGNTWIESTAANVPNSLIGTQYCTCGPGKYKEEPIGNIYNPTTCTDCTNGKYQDEQAFIGSSCTKQCSADDYSPSGASSCDFKSNSCPIGTYSNEPASCVSCGAEKSNNQVGMTSVDSCSIVCGSYCCTTSTNPPFCDSVPDGNKANSAAGRVGFLGGLVDDYFQLYLEGWHPGTTSLSNKPSNSMSKAHVISKYGPIEKWDTSKVTDISNLFLSKKGINPNISNWRVDKVVGMSTTFREADSFNIDLSSWDVSSMTHFYQTFYFCCGGWSNDIVKCPCLVGQTFCGHTWIDTTASFHSTFEGGSNRIGTEYCNCGPGRYLTKSPKLCSSCPSGTYQEKAIFTGSSCTVKECPKGHLVSSTNKSLCIKLGSNV